VAECGNKNQFLCCGLHNDVFTTSKPALGMWRNIFYPE